MKNNLELLYKRRSMRKYEDEATLTKKEHKDICEKFYEFKPLIEGIKYEIKIVDSSETTCRKNLDYILFYSEKKDNYLLNAGYLLEQLDLYLTSINIGCCFLGTKKPKERKDGDLEFVIMMCIGRVRFDRFRTSESKPRRKKTKNIWNSDLYLDVANYVKYAPSSFNSQPWKVKVDEEDTSIIDVYQTGLTNTIVRKFYFYTIDLGIFLYLMDFTFTNLNYKFEKEIFGKQKNSLDLIHIAKYKIIKD